MKSDSLVTAVVSAVTTVATMAAAKLKKVGQIDVSAESFRVIVEVEGTKMLEARRAGLLNPDWTKGNPEA